MKARLLVGLLTVALGGLTSCSNILEENGVINNVAESGMGELRINLTTDPTVEAITKAGSEDPSNFFVQIDQQSYNYNTWKNGLTVAEGDNKFLYQLGIKNVSTFLTTTEYEKNVKQLIRI